MTDWAEQWHQSKIQRCNQPLQIFIGFLTLPTENFIVQANIFFSITLIVLFISADINIDTNITHTKLHFKRQILQRLK